MALGIVMKHLEELGITLTVDIPRSSCKRLLALSKGDKDAVTRIEAEMAKLVSQAATVDA